MQNINGENNMTIERDKKGRFIKGGTKNPNSYIWKKREKQHKGANRKGLTKENNKSVLKQSKTLSKTWKKQLKEGRKTPFMKGLKYWVGKSRSKKTKEKISETNRKLRINQLKQNGISHPCIGKNEKIILDSLEKSNNIKIIRQYQIIGYFVDGYCKKINTIFEIDEVFHNKTAKKDKCREKIIKKELNCEFIRIKDV